MKSKLLLLGFTATIVCALLLAIGTAPPPTNQTDGKILNILSISATTDLGGAATIMAPTQPNMGNSTATFMVPANSFYFPVNDNGAQANRVAPNVDGSATNIDAAGSVNILNSPCSTATTITARIINDSSGAGGEFIANNGNINLVRQNISPPMANNKSAMSANLGPNYNGNLRRQTPLWHLRV